MFTAFLHGWFLCLGLILPLGVQNVFVFNQGAQHRRWFAALPTVITAGICDSLLILLAIGGVSVLVLKTPPFRYALSAVGIGFLLYMGWATWRSRPDPAAGDGGTWSIRRQILFAASVSLLNPHAIIDGGRGRPQFAGLPAPSSLRLHRRLPPQFLALVHRAHDRRAFHRHPACTQEGCEASDCQDGTKPPSRCRDSSLVQPYLRHHHVGLRRAFGQEPLVKMGIPLSQVEKPRILTKASMARYSAAGLAAS